MKRFVAIAGVVAGLLVSMQVSAADSAEDSESRNRVVVELFTSQGCSSCPPADALLARLAQRDDVLALALHVDYWDYIGWADSFARPEHTKRQKAYARVAGSRTVYTPQIVVGGVEQIVGTRPMEVAEAVMHHLEVGTDLSMSAVRAGDTLTVSANRPETPVGPVVVQLVRFVPERSVDITRGENAGKTLTYTNIVTDWQILGDWSGQEPLQMEVPVTGTESAAVLMQTAGNGRILAAVRVD